MYICMAKKEMYIWIYDVMILFSIYTNSSLFRITKSYVLIYRIVRLWLWELLEPLKAMFLKIFWIFNNIRGLTLKYLFGPITDMLRGPLKDMVVVYVNENICYGYVLVFAMAMHLYLLLLGIYIWCDFVPIFVEALHL